MSNEWIFTNSNERVWKKGNIDSRIVAIDEIYLFPHLPDGVDDYDFAENLANHGVLVIPGSEFGAPRFIWSTALK